MTQSVDVPPKKQGKADPPRTKIGQREASVEKLLNAALQLFVSAGYRATTLDQIAAAAGLTKGAVYFYFRSKEAVLMALLDRIEITVIDPVIEKLRASQGSALDKLILFFNYQAGLSLSRGDEILLLILKSLDMSDPESAASRRIRDILDKQHKRIEALILQGRKDGTIRRDVSAKELTAIVIALHDGTFMEWYRRGAALKGAELVRAVRAIALKGLPG